MYAKSGIEYTPTLLVQYGGPWAEEYYFQREKPYDDVKIRRFMPYEHLAPKTRRRGAGVGTRTGGWFMEDEYIFPETARIAAEDVVKAGGKIPAWAGSHGEFQGLGYHWELWSVGFGGMPAHDALRMATLVGAEALGSTETWARWRSGTRRPDRAGPESPGEPAEQRTRSAM